MICAPGVLSLRPDPERFREIEALLGVAGNDQRAISAVYGPSIATLAPRFNAVLQEHALICP